MLIQNALDIKKGAMQSHNRIGTLTQPLQFLPRAEKTQEWCAWNMDWIEWEGLKQLRRNSEKIMKNYKLAAGHIDRGDYIPETDNDYKDMIQQLSHQGGEIAGALELKFYPIIPNVIDTLTAEFAKRNKRVQFHTTDEYSFNEILEQKRAQIEQVLVQDAQQKLVMNMINAGADPNDPAFQEQLQQQTSPEKIKTLPEIERFFAKDYKTMAEEWASKQHQIDEGRFKMDELEERAFRDSLICDREFWHFNMYEDDYDIEVWNPATVFYHKSPDVRYISEGNWVGRVDMMSIADVIDKYGWRMTQEQMESLEAIYPVRAAGYPIGGLQNDGSFYDGTKSHASNTNQPSLAYRQYTSMVDNYLPKNGDIVQWIFSQSENFPDLDSAQLMRVTTAYWKSQRKVGHLTKIDQSGDVTTMVVDEDYKITDPPIYNNQLLRAKDRNTLVFGEHIEWIYLNEVMGGVKIGPTHPTFWGLNTPGGISPIYLGINQNEIKPLRFQFKGESNIYKAKLPVEGRVFSDRNTTSNCPVDKMKAFQIGFNMVNNQIADILIDEIGSVLLLDHNTLPQHSMNEDWGKNNYAKAYQVMKDFQIMPVDSSISNTESGLGFSHFQVLNLEQTQRILSRVSLANYFKQQCYEAIGASPVRMGQPIGQHTTATAVEQTMVGSYAQTEMLFKQHSDDLMPRVHQMRTDLAQYYHSTKSSVRLQMMTSMDERVNFQINGKELSLRDINVYASASVKHRELLEKLQRMAQENNTSGSSLYDLGSIMQADSVGTVNTALKAIETKVTNQRREDMAHAEKLKQMEIEKALKEKEMALDHEARENEKNRRKDILVAEIKAAGFGAMKDFNENNQSDFLDAMKDIKASTEYQDSINLQREKETNRDSQFQSKQNLEYEKLRTQKELKEIDLNIARENKTSSEIKKRQEPKKKK